MLRLYKVCYSEGTAYYVRVHVEYTGAAVQVEMKGSQVARKGCRCDSESNMRLADCKEASQILNLKNRGKVTLLARAKVFQTRF
jgi:hypothetical protein